MIIDNTYFKGELYIPHAKPGITDDVTEVDGAIINFIDEYVVECLIKSLGYDLYSEFSAVLDKAKPNGLTDGTEEKWNQLLNGFSYIDPISSKTVAWRGIRYKSIATGDYNKSFLANYVYYFYEKNDYITRSDAGHQILKATNAENVLPNEKVTRAWNKMVDMIQGANRGPNYGYKNGMPYVDYFNQNNQEVSLSKFIKDSNIILDGTYANYNPYVFGKLNAFGL